MIIRNAHDVPPLKVHDLNEIVVLVDRSETALTEVGLNTWPAGIQGPPHAHTEKEQIFLILTGKGRVIAAGTTFRAEPGDIVYIPPGVEHQTVVEAGQPLMYLLFNAFLDATKEGHGSFAEHIEQVRDTRKAQAEGRASSGTSPRTDKVPATGNLEKGAKVSAGALSATIVLSRSLTVRSEVVMVKCPSSCQDVEAGESNREQVLYIMKGQGTLTITNEANPRPTTQGDGVYIPARTAFEVKSAEDELQYVKFYTDCVSASGRR